MREPDPHTARAVYDAIAPIYADKFKSRGLIYVPG
jgi:hypothetical protein